MKRGVQIEGTADDLRRAYESHWQTLLRLCELLVRDQDMAEDIVQDVFIRARGRLQGLSDAATYAYLRRATLNEWKNRLRSQEAERRARLRIGPTADIGPGDADERDLMWRHIMTLPGRQRAVLVLRYYEDLPDREIARLLGCAQVTVRSQAKRALTKLREVIEG